MTDQMQGKVVLITGATSGIGQVTALELAKMGATIVGVGRNPDRIAATRSLIQQQTGSSPVDFLTADLSSMGQVRGLAEQFKERYPRLDVLINNAGAVFAQRQVTVDGYEMTFAFNHLAYFLLTNLLLERIRASAPSRIINVSSAAHTFGPINFDDLQSQHYHMSGFRAYGQSKLANVMFTYELARRLAGTGVTVNALHPGTVNTGFGKNNPGWMKIGMAISGLFSITPQQGAETSIYLASSPEVQGVTGRYFANCKPVRSSPVSYDEAAQKRLWQISEELTGLSEPEKAI